MPERRLTCPACNQTLRVDSAVTDPWLTCPHCLTQVMNPAHAVRQGLPPEQPPPAPRPTCPECGQIIEASWAYCPYCNAPLRQRRRRSGRAEVDVEVKRDTTGSSVALGIFALVVVTALILFFASGGGELVAASDAGPVILLVGVVVLFVLGVGFASLVASSRTPGTRALSGVLGALSVGLTVALTTLALILFAVLSFIASVVATCGKCGNP